MSTRSRRQRSGWILAAFVAASAAAQIGGLAVVHFAFPPPPPPDPRLTLGFEGSGKGTLAIADANLLCDSECFASFAPGTRVTVVAKPAEGSYLDGWSDECTSGESFTQCTVTVDKSRQLYVFFEEVSDEIDVEWVSEQVDPDSPIQPPDPVIAKLALPQLPPPPRPPEPEKPPELQLPPPEPAQPQPPAPKPPQEEKYEKRAVEVDDDKNVVEDEPEDADFYSDKNRNVAEQTRAENTNLEREQKGPKNPEDQQAFSEKNDNQDEEVGAEETIIAQLEDSEAAELDNKDAPETDKSGDARVAEGQIRGDEGDEGDKGEGGDGREGRKPGVMSMRGVTSRGAPGGPVVADPSRKRGTGGKQGKVGDKGKKGINTDISYEDYERIVGKEKAEAELRVARRTKSKKKGRWRRQRERVMSSLENFVPEVQPGNQTALRTAARPFAVYIARMHRRIHELWAFGYLPDLDSQPQSSPLNDRSLYTKLELVINPDGTIHKATVVKHSGVTQFDVAALDVVFTAEPYEETPKSIRSPDGKAYIHWRFRRNNEACGTFGVERFILDKPPGDSPESGLLSNENLRRRKKDDNGRTGTGQQVGRGGGDPAAAARANANLPSPDDPKAERVAAAWVQAFEQGDVSGLVQQSAVPFTSGGNVVAKSRAALSGVYGSIIREARKRNVVDFKVLSPAGYRKVAGQLPRGVDPSHLLLVVRTRGDQFALLMKPNGAGGYVVVGFER